MSDAIVFIPLTGGKVAVIDFEDFEKVRPYKWHVLKMRGPRWYAHTHQPGSGKSGKKLAMHRVILDAPLGFEVDHIDGDGLNNCKSNLRLCSRAQNAQAHQNKWVGATSRFRGVCRDNRRSVWRATIKTKGIQFYLGCFKNEEDAARAYDKKARELFGAHAAPNFST